MLLKYRRSVSNYHILVSIDMGDITVKPNRKANKKTIGIASIRFDYDNSENPYLVYWLLERTSDENAHRFSTEEKAIEYINKTMGIEIIK